MDQASRQQERLARAEKAKEEAAKEAKNDEMRDTWLRVQLPGFGPDDVSGGQTDPII